MHDNWEGWDEAVYTLTYENGVMVTEHLTYNTDSMVNQQCIRIFSGTKGMITTDKWGNRIEVNGESRVVCKNPSNSLEFGRAGTYGFRSGSGACECHHRSSGGIC